MKKILYPSKERWKQLCRRPQLATQDLEALVSDIFRAVQFSGDDSIRKYASLFDKLGDLPFELTSEEIEIAVKKVPEKLQDAIRLAASNIEKFHRTQVAVFPIVETSKGVVCWQETRAIGSVGLYIPGGSAPLFSTVLMLGIPAKIAGCEEVVLCTPCDKNGEVNPAILFAAELVGITRIFRVGGIQSIAAMTFGSESFPKVSKIFGPGNQYVNAAKKKAQDFGVAIDLPAGPSEVLVIADLSANPEFVASDLLSQAEHGSDSQVVLLSSDEAIFNDVIDAVNRQLQELPRFEIAKKALENSRFVLLENLGECLDFSNEYAPEHMILAIENPENYLPKIQNAGSVFIGNWSPESAGDYASGTNHTLPTNGFAKNYSGVSVDSFVKKISFQKISKQGLREIGDAIEQMAQAESLFAHKNAVSIRLKSIEND